MLTLNFHTGDFLVVMYLRPNVRALKSVYTFYTKIYDSINNYAHHGRNQIHIRILEVVIFCKTIGCLHAANDWNYIHSIKTQHFNSYSF